jgi:hypothetical protein
MAIQTSSVGTMDPYGPTIKKTTLFEGLFGGANAMSDLLNKGYKNQQDAAKAQYAQATLGDSIAATNATNQADAQYYPLQQMFKTQQEEQTVKEIMARTGLTYAQAKEVAARTNLVNTQQQALTDPTMMFDSLYKKLQTLPQGSPQQAYVRSILNGMLNGAGASMPSGASRGAGASRSVQLFPSMGNGNAGLQFNPLQTSKSGYHQAVMFDESGNPITVESPTTASGTRNQMRAEAEQEGKYILPTVLQGINNYQGVSPTASMLWDSMLARYGSGKSKDAARQRLQDYTVASKFIPEVAAINARQATGQSPGIELVREFTNKMFPSMPLDMANAFIPADIKVKANNTYPAMQQGMANQAINTARQGYVQPGMPAWATQGNPYPNGMIDESGNYVPPQPAAQRQAQPQVDPAQLQAMAADAIVKGAPPEAVKARLQQMLGGMNGQ